MRIALSNPDVNRGGGIERVVTEVANRLAGRGHRVTVVASRVEDGVLREEVAVRRVPVPARLDAHVGLGFRRRAAGALREIEPDVHGAFSVLSPLGGVFWVPSVHRIAVDLLLSHRSPAGRLAVSAHPYHRIRLALERSMLRPGASRRVLAQTDAVREEIARCYDNADVEVVPLGFSHEEFDPDSRRRRRVEVRRQLALGDEDRVLLFVGNELERKGFDVLMRAVTVLGEGAPIVLGAGRVAPASHPRLRWVGHSRDIAGLHAAADAFVLPTLYEPWGLAIVEAQGSGLPVITSRRAGAAVTVEHRRTGYLLEDPRDPDELAGAIGWALSGQAAPDEAIAQAVVPYRWESIVSRYETHLDEAGRA